MGAVGGIDLKVSHVLSELAEELRRLKEELPLAIKRAAEAFREDPTRSSQNSATFRKAQMADKKVNAIKHRIASIEAQRSRPPTRIGGRDAVEGSGGEEGRVHQGRAKFTGDRGPATVCRVEGDEIFHRSPRAPRS
jgi:hypothetical protein